MAIASTSEDDSTIVVPTRLRCRLGDHGPAGRGLRSGSSAARSPSRRATATGAPIDHHLDAALGVRAEARPARRAAAGSARPDGANLATSPGQRRTTPERDRQERHDAPTTVPIRRRGR